MLDQVSQLNDNNENYDSSIFKASLVEALNTFMSLSAPPLAITSLLDQSQQSTLSEWPVNSKSGVLWLRWSHLHQVIMRAGDKEVGSAMGPLHCRTPSSVGCEHTFDQIAFRCPWVIKPDASIGSSGKKATVLLAVTEREESFVAHNLSLQPSHLSVPHLDGVIPGSTSQFIFP